MSTHTPTIRRTAEQQAELENGLRQGFEKAVPFHHLLGLEVLAETPDDTRIAIAMRPDLIGNTTHQRLHGGAIAAVLDAAAGFAICVALAEKFCDETLEQVGARFARVGTIDMRVDYLRQAQGKRFVAAAKVTRLGGRLASTQMELTDDGGEIIATGAAAYVVS